MTIMELLLNSGADVNFTPGDEVREGLLGVPSPEGPDHSLTPLFIACARGQVEVADLLIRHGASVNAHGTHARGSCLMIASHYGHTQVVLSLLAAGADVRAEDFLGRTALDWAQPAILPVLLRALENVENALETTVSTPEAL